MIERFRIGRATFGHLTFGYSQNLNTICMEVQYYFTDSMQIKIHIIKIGNIHCTKVYISLLYSFTFRSYIVIDRNLHVRQGNFHL